MKPDIPNPRVSLGALLVWELVLRLPVTVVVDMVLLNSVTVDTSLKGVSCGDGVVIPVAVIDDEEAVEAAAVRDLLYEHVAGVKVVQELSAGIYVDTAVSHSMVYPIL